MPKNVRVNIRTKVDNAAIRHENREGRAVIIVPSATLPDDIVMNGILYPADEIAKSFETLERTPAPLGHPFHGNQFIPATDPEAINSFWVGAHNENVRQEDGRVLLDKVIDVENAGRTERGLELLNAIEEGDPIHTSTGIFMEIEESKRKNIRGIARNMVFDHDAILIGEQGAATPDQGVGMMVNGEELEVINSCIEDQLECEIDNMGIWLMDSIVREEKASRWAAIRDKVVSFIKEALQSDDTEAFSLNTNRKEDQSMVTDEQFETLSKQVETLVSNADGLATAISEAVTAALKPITEKVETLATNAQELKDAERAGYTKILVDSGLLSEDETKEMSVNVLKTLADKAQPGTAAPVAGQFNLDKDDEDMFKDVDLNANIDKAMGVKADA